MFAALAVPFLITAQDQSSAEGDNRGQTRYTIVDLGPVGPQGAVLSVSKNGLAAGAALARDGVLHGALWLGTLKIDIGNPGLGGPNSEANGVSDTGVAGAAQSSETNTEDFCGFNFIGLPPSNTACVPFVLQNGVVKALHKLGGANGVANSINDSGVAVGWAETGVKEKNCLVSQFKPVAWKDGKIYELPTYKGDTDGIAAQINDKGQVVGASGTCGGPFNPNGNYLLENHPVLWEKDGKEMKVIDLGNLGGAGGLAGNHACALNNRGQVVGHSQLKNNSTFHGFIWTKEKQMRDLGTLPGDQASLALGINDPGTIVGASLQTPTSIAARAVIWRGDSNSSMVDLNTLIDGSSNLNLQLAFSINDRGEIVGLALNDKGEPHGFLAIPCP